MGWEAWFTLGVLGLTLALLARETYAPAHTMLGAVILLLVAGVISGAEAFSGFGNPAPITVAALYVLARAVEKTGLLQPVLAVLLGRTPGERGPLRRLLPTSAAASAFLNNTPMVAMLIPPIIDWAHRSGRSPSRYLMPVSYAVILGGVTTVMGTSTNLVMSGLLEARTGTPMGFFEITPVGLPVAIVGVTLLIVLSPWLLPDRLAPRDALGAQVAREFTVHMLVAPGGALDTAKGTWLSAGPLVVSNARPVFIRQPHAGGMVPRHLMTRSARTA